MKIKIGENGNLIINNKVRYCPRIDGMTCGDWCALFKVNNAFDDYAENSIIIELCCVNHYTVIEDFTDERKGK